MKTRDGQDTAQEEADEDDALRDGKGRLRAFRRQNVQRREVKEALHNEDKEVEIEGNHSAYRIDPAPGA